MNVQNEFDKFFEFDTDDKSYVTSISCRLFAEHCCELVRDEKIAHLEAKLQIATDALENIKECVSEDWSQKYADEALKQIRGEV